MDLHFRSVFANGWMLVDGLGVTALVSLATVLLSFVLALALSALRVARSRPLRAIGVVYIDIFRNTPFLVQLFFFYYGLPEIGLYLGPIETGILALSLSTAASNAEVIRAGLETVDRGIVEAGRSFAMTTFQIYRYILMPIALRVAWRPLGSVFINMVLTTSVLSTITVNDLMGNAMTLSAKTFRPFEVYITVLVLYCLITFTLSGLINAINAIAFEKRARG